MKKNKPNLRKKTTGLEKNELVVVAHKLRYRLLKQHWLYSRWGVGLLIVLIVMVFSFPSGVGIHAAESHVYPTYCLGGWQNPQNAGGQPDLELQAATNDFNLENSAILKDALADMFCGYFQGETHDNPPSRAVLKFSWQIDSSAYVIPTPEEPTPVPSAEKVEPDMNAQIDELPAREPEVGSDSTVPAPADELNLGAPVQAQFVRSHDSVKVAVVDEVFEPVPTPSPEVTPEPVPVEIQPEPTPAPEPIGIEPVPTPSSEVTPEPVPVEIQPEPTPAPITVTSETSDEGSGFLEAQYSFDGLQWHSLGLVNMGNWRSFQPEIPIRSWDDIGKLQVVLSARSTFDVQPVVKLDGMWLEAEYSPTFIEAIEDLGDQTNEFLSDLVNTTGDSLNELNDALTPGEQEAEALKALEQVKNQNEAVEAAPAPIVEPPAPALIAKRHLLFTADGVSIPTSSILPWYTRDDLRLLKLDEKNPATLSQPPALEQSVSGKSLVVSGNCDANHYVVLLYKNSEDYKKNPGAYAVNVAKPCVGGQFQFDLINIPDTLSVGTYYLLVGAQGSEGPWRPASAMATITIGSTIEEEQQ